MSTYSEQLISKISEKSFFPKYVYKNALFQDENVEQELCDILIEFANFYVCIQVKEKRDDGNSSNYTWFKNKVLMKAVKQTKETVKNLAKNNIEFYAYAKDGKIIPLLVDREKIVLPIIVFYNSRYKLYNIHYFSKSLNRSINIFSYDDFYIMLDTIIIPYDILGYIIERSSYISEYGEQRLVIDDSAEEFTLLCRPQSEKNYSEMYLVKNYFKQKIETGYVKFYNELVPIL